MVESFADSTSGSPTEATRFELRGGTLATVDDAARWAAVRLDSAEMEFAPVARARNRLVWHRGSADEWAAVLTWPPADGAGAPRVRSYRMTRLR